MVRCKIWGSKGREKEGRKEGRRPRIWNLRVLTQHSPTLENLEVSGLKALLKTSEILSWQYSVLAGLLFKSLMPARRRVCSAPKLMGFCWKYEVNLIWNKKEALSYEACPCKYIISRRRWVEWQDLQMPQDYCYCSWGEDVGWKSIRKAKDGFICLETIKE